MERRAFVCSICDSDDLIYEGNLHWDVDQQDLVITDKSAVADPWCTTCESNVFDKKVVIEPSK